MRIRAAVVGSCRLGVRAALLCLALWGESSPVGAAIEVADDTGQRIRLMKPAGRIVVLAPHLTELLFEAGAGGQVVGTVAHSDYPAAARSIARVGDARVLDLERIVKLRPQLVVAWSSGSPKRQLARLRAFGIPVFSQDASRLADIAATIEQLGLLAGTETVARARAQAFRERLAKYRRERRDVPRVRVFYQIWDRPLLTVNANHVITDALEVCGAQNVFGASALSLPRPSAEAVLREDPDAIIAAAAPGRESAVLKRWRPWVRLRAVRSGKLFTVDPDLLHRPSARILDGLAQLCERVDAARMP